MTNLKRKAEKSLESIGSILRNVIPNGTGFALFIFNVGPSDDGFITYTANCNRQNMIKAIREWLSHVED